MSNPVSWNTQYMGCLRLVKAKGSVELPSGEDPLMQLSPEDCVLPHLPATDSKAWMGVQQERAGEGRYYQQRPLGDLSTLRIAEQLELHAPVAGRAVQWQLLHLGQRLVVWHFPQALMTDMSPEKVGHCP